MAAMFSLEMLPRHQAATVDSIEWSRLEAPEARRLRELGYGWFHYAPKADAFLRRRWREPHPDAALAELGEDGFAWGEFAVFGEGAGLAVDVF